MRQAAHAMLPFLAAWCCFAADDPDLLSRIRNHMREYLGRLPDYTCRVTIERSRRRNARDSFDVTDRLRLDIAYATGHEYYAWPGDERFERSIDELLPAHGLVSEGSWALHMRKLFLTNDAQFAPPRSAAGLVQLDFVVPAASSGFAVPAGGQSAPVALHGSVWFAPDTLDVRRLEVRVEETPPSLRVAGTREVTVYAAAVVGDVPAVLPTESDLLLRDRDGSEDRNRSRFDDCHRYAGTATVRYGATPVEPDAAPPAVLSWKRGDVVEATFAAGIPADVAIGDVLTSGAVKVRVIDLHQAGKKWSIEFSLIGARATVRKTLSLPSPPGTSISLRVE